MVMIRRMESEKRCGVGEDREDKGMGLGECGR